MNAITTTMNCRCSRCGREGHRNTMRHCPSHPKFEEYWKDEARKEAEKAIKDAQAYFKRWYIGNKITNDMKARAGSSRNGCVIQLMNHLKELEPIPTGIVDKFYRITGIKENPNKCFWCKKKLLKQIDKEHIIPTCKTKTAIYGTNYVINIVPSCKDCNGKKSAKTGEELKVFLRERSWDEPNIEQFMTFIEENKKWYMADESKVEMLEEMFLEINDFHSKMAKKIEYRLRRHRASTIIQQHMRGVDVRRRWAPILQCHIMMGVARNNPVYRIAKEMLDGEEAVKSISATAHRSRRSSNVHGGRSGLVGEGGAGLGCSGATALHIMDDGGRDEDEHLAHHLASLDKRSCNPSSFH